MKNLIKILTIIIFMIFILLIFFEIDTEAADFDTDDWEPNSMTSVSGANKFEGFANKIIGGIKVAGTSVSVIMLVIIGIKYIFGSIEEKAEYKKTLKPYIIGAILLFGITNILVIIQEFAEGF